MGSTSQAKKRRGSSGPLASHPDEKAGGDGGWDSDTGVEGGGSGGAQKLRRRAVAAGAGWTAPTGTKGPVAAGTPYLPDSYASLEAAYLADDRTLTAATGDPAALIPGSTLSEGAFAALDVEDQKKTRRLIRNRLSAQLHRQRQRAHIDTLEAQVTELSALIEHYRTALIAAAESCTCGAAHDPAKVPPILRCLSGPATPGTLGMTGAGDDHGQELHEAVNQLVASPPAGKASNKKGGTANLAQALGLTGISVNSSPASLKPHAAGGVSTIPGATRATENTTRRGGARSRRSTDTGEDASFTSGNVGDDETTSTGSGGIELTADHSAAAANTLRTHTTPAPPASRAVATKQVSGSKRGRPRKAKQQPQVVHPASPDETAVEAGIETEFPPVSLPPELAFTSTSMATSLATTTAPSPLLPADPFNSTSNPTLPATTAPSPRQILGHEQEAFVPLVSRVDSFPLGLVPLGGATDPEEPNLSMSSKPGLLIPAASEAPPAQRMQSWVSSTHRIPALHKVPTFHPPAWVISQERASEFLPVFPSASRQPSFELVQSTNHLSAGSYVPPSPTSLEVNFPVTKVRELEDTVVKTESQHVADSLLTFEDIAEPSHPGRTTLDELRARTAAGAGSVNVDISSMLRNL